MSQHDMTVDNGAGVAVRADINLALKALASQSSGASAPSPTYPAQMWADTSTERLKQRDAADAAWIDRGPLNSAMTTLAAYGITDAALDSTIGFTIIYPNGGTSASPATAAPNSRYVTANPFPGFSVLCKAELLSGGEWIEAGWMTWREPLTPYSYLSVGARATQHNSGDIVVVTGINHVLWTTNTTGQSKDTAPIVSAPVRVKVWKLKG